MSYFLHRRLCFLPLESLFYCESYHSSEALASLMTKPHAYIRHWCFSNICQQAFFLSMSPRCLEPTQTSIVWLTKDLALDWTNYNILFVCHIVCMVEQPDGEKSAPAVVQRIDNEDFASKTRPYLTPTGLHSYTVENRATKDQRLQIYKQST